MDINRLEEFIVLADCLNYSKAASILYLTQPVLSRHINDMEEALGAQLFIRDTHKVSLTPVGELAAKELRIAMDAYHTAVHHIKLATDELNSRISVGFLGEAVRPFIAKFSQYIGNGPNLHVDYTSATELDILISNVDKEELDLAFITHIETNRMQGMEVRWIMDNPLYVVLPTGNELARRDAISIRELSGRPMVAYDRATNPHTALFHEKLFQHFGAEMNVVRKVSNMESGLFYTSVGVGAFIIPEHLIDQARDLPVIPISDPEALISLHLIWKKSNAKTSVRTFVKEFTNFYKREFPQEERVTHP